MPWLGVLVLAGCSTSPPPPDTLEVYDGPKRPAAEVSRIVNNGDVVLMAVDDKGVRGFSWKPGTLRSQITYEVLPGTRKLRIGRAIGEVASSRWEEKREVTAQLLAGRTYLLTSQARVVDGKRDWECAVVEQGTGRSVSQLLPLRAPKIDR